MSLQNHGSKSETLINAKPEARGASISEVGKLKMQEKPGEKKILFKKKIGRKQTIISLKRLLLFLHLQYLRDIERANRSSTQ